MTTAEEFARRIAKMREMIQNMEDEKRTLTDAIKDLKDREMALTAELLATLCEE